MLQDGERINKWHATYAFTHFYLSRLRILNSRLSKLLKNISINIWDNYQRLIFFSPETSLFCRIVPLTLYCVSHFLHAGAETYAASQGTFSCQRGRPCQWQCVKSARFVPWNRLRRNFLAWQTKHERQSNWPARNRRNKI